MREIKLRMWNKKHELMSEPEVLFNSSPFHLDLKFVDKDNKYKDGFINLNEGEIVPMQYTGLKDKNGVEIYEGDVLQYEGEAYEVDFNSGKFRGKRTTYKTNEIWGVSLEDAEVIGNIYENPELVERTTV